MNRNEFLRQLGVLTGGVAFGLPGVAGRAYAHNPFAIDMDVTNGNILVLVQLSGGNDGLNTVVPFENDVYYQKRATIAIQKDKVLKLNSQLGLNPALGAFRELYDKGQLSIVQNVGYASPNRSHFRSTDIWLSATDANVYEYDGWVGRYLEQRFPAYPVKMPDQPMAVQLGSVESMLLQSSVGSMATVFDNPDAFYQLVRGSSASTDIVPNTVAGDELKFLQQIAAQSVQYADIIKKKADAGKNTLTYPTTNLGRQLAIVADLISGGMTTPVYLTTIGGFDTHANQVTAGNTTAGSHANLLKTVADAVAAFQKDLQQQNLANRVTVMTFSEFGRRVGQNGTTGTDHGTAAPLFVVGNTVRGGIVGTAPDLKDLDSNGDLKFKNDFRQVYASVLSDHLGVENAVVKQILGRDFETLPIFRQAPLLEVKEGLFALGQNTPNPFADSTEIQFSLKTTQTARLALYDMQGRELAVLREGRFEAGNYAVPLSGAGFVPGHYLYSLQTDEGRAVRRLMKI
ncbi:DUF1501 domain-containing protein [Spirosoma montaniterrae]|uniref:Secretion system C-terminal sorting domain-containing protein n=1 Tax=Spirosoma montaniterrae TaxID=1178516 RepID=A0A1P9WSQ5_9BACT|nr:DUF1501 domain-containing protein [Spirosoma montaniterrae]AQG78415.1 hypothetical protein AWR27_03120 [Spirosoma montaniterrae]